MISRRKFLKVGAAVTGLTAARALGPLADVAQAASLQHDDRRPVPTTRHSTPSWW
jgi:hypothetical protein